jgi:disulfide bond formation protein DsbB
MKNMRPITKFALWIGTLQAWAALLGSLTASELMELIPCDMCWWQRAMFYPLVPIFTISLVRKEPRNAAIYSIPMVIVGWCFAIYQVLLQQGVIKFDGPCSAQTIACSTKQLPLILPGNMGDIDLIPLGSFIGFSIMIVVIWTILKTTSKAK